MLSKNTIKLVSSLSLKKFRDEHQLFVAEGTKLLFDLLPTFTCKHLFATREWLDQHKIKSTVDVVEVTENELQKLSNQKTPQGVVAVFEKPQISWEMSQITGKLNLALDGVQDPGNLGTIIRIADWFGITDIFCSENCADVYGSKTIQATMGALARVQVHTVPLVDFIKSCCSYMPVYGTFMDGQNIYSETLTPAGLIIMGNEGKGISSEIEALVTKKLLIPNFPEGEITSESLNVGVATALVCGEFRRRQLI